MPARTRKKLQMISTETRAAIRARVNEVMSDPNYEPLEETLRYKAIMVVRSTYDRLNNLPPTQQTTETMLQRAALFLLMREAMEMSGGGHPKHMMCADQERYVPPPKDGEDVLWCWLEGYDAPPLDELGK